MKITVMWKKLRTNFEETEMKYTRICGILFLIIRLQFCVNRKKLSSFEYVKIELKLLSTLVVRIPKLTCILRYRIHRVFYRLWRSTEEITSRLKIQWIVFLMVLGMVRILSRRMGLRNLHAGILLKRVFN